MVYWKSLDRVDTPIREAHRILKKKAKEIAQTLSFKMDKVGLIFDNSLSMYGTKEQPYHPMLRAMALSLVLEQVSSEFTVYYTNPTEDSLFPRLGNQSNYAEPVLDALKDKCDTIVIVGDGYENAPFEGALHQLLYVYKKKVDKQNNLLALHFNPIYGAETKDARPITDLAPTVGVREVKGLNEAMFLAIGKSQPMVAVQKYLSYLVTLQSNKVKALMPEPLKKAVAKRDKTGLLGM